MPSPSPTPLPPRPRPLLRLPLVVVGGGRGRGRRRRRRRTWRRPWATRWSKPAAPSAGAPSPTTLPHNTKQPPHPPTLAASPPLQSHPRRQRRLFRRRHRGRRPRRQQHWPWPSRRRRCGRAVRRGVKQLHAPAPCGLVRPRCGRRGTHKAGAPPFSDRSLRLISTRPLALAHPRPHPCLSHCRMWAARRVFVQCQRLPQQRRPGEQRLFLFLDSIEEGSGRVIQPPLTQRLPLPLTSPSHAYTCRRRPWSTCTCSSRWCAHRYVSTALTLVRWR